MVVGGNRGLVSFGPKTNCLPSRPEGAIGFIREGFEDVKLRPARAQIRLMSARPARWACALRQCVTRAGRERPAAPAGHMAENWPAGGGIKFHLLPSPEGGMRRVNIKEPRYTYRREPEFGVRDGRFVD